MEALTLIGLIGNIIGFVDFGSKVVTKSIELCQSGAGALEENVSIENAAKHLVDLSDKLKGTGNTGDILLSRLCASCNSTAQELIAALDKLRVEGKTTKWKSIRKALKSIWTKEKIQEIEQRISRIRDGLNLHVVTDLRYANLYLIYKY
jgi:hypothetical protein